MKRIPILCLTAILVLLAACSTQPMVTYIQETAETDSTMENIDDTKPVAESKNPTYNDYYNQALDEEYWANIPDTPAEEFDYEIVNTNDMPEDIKNATASRLGIAQIPDKVVWIDYYIGNAQTVRIPETINGYPVTLLNSAFTYQKDGSPEPEIKELYIPDTVSYQGGYCGFLEKVRLPQKSFDESTPYNMRSPKLKSIVIFGNTTTYLHVGDIRCDSLKEMFFSENVEEIIIDSSEEPFPALEYVGIPSSVNFIGVRGLGVSESGKKRLENQEVDVFNGTEVTVICQEGSYAQEYAERFGMKTFIVE